MKPLLLTCFFGFCCLLLIGCTVQLLYNQLDWLIPWYIDEYVELTREQDDALQRRVHSQLHWHRSTQLPTYANSIYQLVNQLQRGITRSELDALYLAAEAYWRDFARRLTPDVVAMLATLSDRQVAQLIESLHEKQREYRKQYVDPPQAEQRRNRAKRVTGHLEKWLGSLTSAQEQTVKAWSERYTPTSRDTLYYRGVWQERFKAALATRRDTARFRATLSELIMYPEKNWSDDYRARLKSNRELFKDLVLELQRQLTAKQRDHLSRKLALLAHDFNQLAKAD